MQIWAVVAHIAKGYLLLYPLTMSFIWMFGAIVFYLRYERIPHRIVSQPPDLADYPLVAVLIPCHNEERNIEETIGALMHSKYPNYEVIAINDGSTDRTGEVLDRLSQRHERLRVIHLVKNQGKAVGLNTAALLTRADLLIGIDGDALLDPWAVHWLVRHFERPSVAAVTGNPRMRNRSTLLGRIQVGEFSAMVGMIKRAQRSNGAIFTVSGVVAAFRRSALHEVGYWTPHRLTEDVDVSWKLQLAGWELHFEPRALCWILMPETLGGLWKQRLRWAAGGAQVILGGWRQILGSRGASLWPMYAEYYLGVLWAWLFAIALTYRCIDLVTAWVDLGSSAILLPGPLGVVLGSVCLAQVLIGFFLDHPYDRDLWRNYVWAIWYPAAFWLIAAAAAVAGTPVALLRAKGERARWHSPDRGVGK
ncbi:poly-beta-1,6-N-acetyl-D-glucosamine synthase [Dyella silvae]|uniref:poly-beta-1,6-N-acetyl-D-glucosamine synthase n=1 Tax=Dyella silvae TaxID=2994424 RepID=UPI002263CCC5|nr:poly-beta-1,6-N-acetyl-D-glucosamine synthase [Dyella silvae]